MAIHRDPITGDNIHVGHAVFNETDERVTGLFESEEHAENFKDNMKHVDNDMHHTKETEIIL